MKNITKFSILLILAAALAFGQTITPNTSLCAAATATAKSVCLTAVTGVANQTGLYIDGEYMVVNLTNTQTLTAGQYVPVIRGARAGTAPAAHANATVVWLALNPAQALVPGSNGFVMGTQLGDIGTCTRTNEVYLPHIWPNRGVKRDCTTLGYWVDYSPIGPDNPIQVLSTATATVPAASGNYVLTKADGIVAVTLVAPTAGSMDGMIIRFYSTSAELHTITCSTHFMMGSAATSLLTFTAEPGAGVTLMAYNGYWIIVANNLVTLTS